MLEKTSDPRESSESETLSLLRIHPSHLSRNYIQNEKQFQLHNLITEQRHAKTFHFSSAIKKDTTLGLQALLSVDEDIGHLCEELAGRCEALENAAEALANAILHKHKIYMYGCGATGRLANQMESAFWRPFWGRLKQKPYWKALERYFPNIENRLIGEMTGGDRALISSLEGFEDLPLIGELQICEHKIQKGDVVFAITEGGETSSVIGAILAASKLYGEASPETCEEARRHLFFFYNNPDTVLYPFDRSRAVLSSKAIRKICLATGPQALAGSTRMQASTCTTFVIGLLLEELLSRVLKPHLSPADWQDLGFAQGPSLREQLLSFVPLQKTLLAHAASLSTLTDLEADTYLQDKFSTYFADRALPTVFIDSTERSPTFRLNPLDPVKEAKRKSWIQVWTPAASQREAWRKFLQRDFHGLEEAFYHEQFSKRIAEPYLRQTALNSLKNAGRDQQFCYDFSVSEQNLASRAPNKGDLGLLILLGEHDPLLTSESLPKFLELFASRGARLAALWIVDKQQTSDCALHKTFTEFNVLCVQIPIGVTYDPLGLRQHLGLKMLLNAHSTGVMAKLGRVIGNAMINVSPGNLKLIGRATYLIQSHVNEVLGSGALTYAEANAVLFDALAFTAQKKSEQTSEVALSILRILEASRTKAYVSWETVEGILIQDGLAAYLEACVLLGKGAWL